MESSVHWIMVTNLLLDDRSTFSEDADHNLTGENVDLIVLAGFLSILTPEFTEKWKIKSSIFTVIIAQIWGQRMYGAKVHQAVLDAGEKFQERQCIS